LTNQAIIPQPGPQAGFAGMPAGSRKIWQWPAWYRRQKKPA